MSMKSIESANKKRGTTLPRKLTAPINCRGENWEVARRIFEETVWEQVKSSAKSFTVDTCSQVTVLDSASASHYNVGIKIANVICDFKFNFNYSLPMEKRRNLHPVNANSIAVCASKVKAGIQAKKQKKLERANNTIQNPLEQNTDVSKPVSSLEPVFVASSVQDEEDQRPYITLPKMEAYYHEEPAITKTYTSEISTQTDDIVEEEPIQIATKPVTEAAFYKSPSMNSNHISNSSIETDEHGNRFYRKPIMEAAFEYHYPTIESDTTSNKNEEEPKYITYPAIEPIANQYQTYTMNSFSEAYLDCNNELKDKIIRIFFALANKRLFKTLIIRKENITDCSWYKNTIFYYKVQLKLNTEDCLYKIKVDGVNNFDLLNSADVLSGYCKDNLTAEYLNTLTSHA